MTFPVFLDCAFTILVEDLQRAGGLDVQSAFDRISEWAAGSVASDGEQSSRPAEMTRNVTAQNDAALAALGSALGNVQGGPAFSV